MDIGTVVSVEICGEDRTCVIIDKKYYSDILFEDDIVPEFLSRFSGPGTNEAINVIIGHPQKLDNIGKIMCYELMYGDNRVWVLGESMVKVQ